MMHGAAGLRHLDALEPRGESFRDVLLKEARRVNPAVKALHGDWPSHDVRQHHRRDRFVILRHLSFRDAVFREEQLVGMADRNNHSRISSRREWRSLRWTVHSMK